MHCYIISKRKMNITLHFLISNSACCILPTLSRTQSRFILIKVNISNDNTSRRKYSYGILWDLLYIYNFLLLLSKKVKKNNSF